MPLTKDLTVAHCVDPCSGARLMWNVPSRVDKVEVFLQMIDGPGEVSGKGIGMIGAGRGPRKNRQVSGHAWNETENPPITKLWSVRICGLVGL